LFVSFGRSNLIFEYLFHHFGNNAIKLKILKMTIYHLKNENELFENIYDLVDYVISAGICPSVEFYKNGEPMGEYAEDFIVA